MTVRTKKVVIHQARLTHYRVPFFELIRDLAIKDGIELRLVHGQPARRERHKRDTGQLEWASVVRNYYLPLFGRDLIYQPTPPDAQNTDLIILQQENRILSNYPHLLPSSKRGSRVAFWGHGANFQSARPDTLRERWKRWFAGRVDWWFAYTETSVEILKQVGYPESRITCLNNSFDTRAFKEQLEQISEGERSALRRSLGMEADDRIALFCGSLYRDKRLDLLFDSVIRVRERIENFHLVIIGDGPERELVRQWHEEHDWIHWVGVATGQEKARWFSVAELMLNPGLVGLHILDSFVAGLPMISTFDSRHGPEICYLEPGVNGLLVEPTVGSYTASIVGLLEDWDKLRSLAQAARTSADQYTVEAMAANFHQGIIKCLNAPRYLP